MLNIRLMTNEECKEYHELLCKTDRTKDDTYRLNKLIKLARLNSIVIKLRNLEALTVTDDNNNEIKLVNILEYENMPSVYRIQVLIKGKYKTIARIKASTKDVHIAIRENTAQALNKKYNIVNYNLPAQYHIAHEEVSQHLKDIVEYHYNNQIA